MTGNIHCLAGGQDDAKTYYRKLLKMGCQPKMESQVLNNLAFSSWMHLLDIKGMQDKKSDKALAIATEAEYIESLLK